MLRAPSLSAWGCAWLGASTFATPWRGRGGGAPVRDHPPPLLRRVNVPDVVPDAVNLFGVDLLHDRRRLVGGFPRHVVDDVLALMVSRFQHRPSRRPGCTAGRAHRQVPSRSAHCSSWLAPRLTRSHAACTAQGPKCPSRRTPRGTCLVGTSPVSDFPDQSRAQQAGR